MTKPVRQTQSVRWNRHTEEWEHRCSYCRDWLPLTHEFWNPKHGMARCTTCWGEYHRAHEARRRGEPEILHGIRASQRAKYWANREKHLEATRRWKAANREHVAAYQREWRARQKDKAA